MEHNAVGDSLLQDRVKSGAQASQLLKKILPLFLDSRIGFLEWRHDAADHQSVRFASRAAA